MSTNYYARILPTQERKEFIKRLIDKNRFDAVVNMVNQTYGKFCQDNVSNDHNCTVEGIVHLGKRAGGWKFLWNPNVYVIREGHMQEIEEDGRKIQKYIPHPSILYYVYPLTKEGIKNFIDREDVIVVDEYGETQDKEEFFNMALNWEPNGWDSASYEEEHPEAHRYRFRNELTEILEREGYKFNSSTNTDFYSDGLRFASYTDFI